MYKKIPLLLAVVCLVQASPISDLINELKPKLREATVKVAEIIHTGGERIGLAYKEIETGITVLDNEIDEHRFEINDAVRKAQKDAKASGKNISACVDQEQEGHKVLNKNRKNLALCRISPELNKVSLKLAALGKLEAVIATSPVKCSLKNRGDLEKIKSCVEDIIADAEKQADETANAIDDSIKEARENANKCVGDAVAPIREQLKKIKDDFVGCIAKA